MNIKYINLIGLYKYNIKLTFTQVKLFYKFS